VSTYRRLSDYPEAGQTSSLDWLPEVRRALEYKRLAKACAEPAGPDYAAVIAYIGQTYGTDPKAGR
jgi:hypothetical protein